MVHYKDIRTYTLLLLLLTVGTPLQAAQLYEEEGKVSATQQGPPAIASQDLDLCDHTLHIGRKVDHEMHDTRDLKGRLADEMVLLANELENKKRELVLATVLQSKQDQGFYKYLFSSAGLLQGKAVVDKAYNDRFGYHLIKATFPHAVIALLEWLGWSAEQSHHNNQIYKIYTPKALHPSLPLCEGCCRFARHMFQIKLQPNEKGCLGQPFPDAIEAFPDLAQQYINTHLTLPLLQKLIAPMMGYVSGTQAAKKEAALQTQLDQRNTQLQERNTALQRQQVQITALKEENSALQAQVNTKEAEFRKKTPPFKKKSKKTLF